MAVCRDYYLTHDPRVIGPPPNAYIEENLCKLDEIQVKLAYLRAWKEVFKTIPGKFYFLRMAPPSVFIIIPNSLCFISYAGLLLTIPFGRLADKFGRKPLLLFGITGELLSYLWMILVCEY